MLLIGYFEGIDSERGIAWRCADSLGLRTFLGYALTERTPDHSSLSVIRRRIDLETHREVFVWVLKVLKQSGLLKGKTLGIDATTLEANAAMRSLVRRDTGAGYEDYLKELARKGIERSKDYPDESFQIRGLWRTDLMFKPNSAERAFDYTFLLVQTFGEGACYCATVPALSEGGHLLGEDCREVEHSLRCFEVATTDAMYSAFEKHPDESHTMTGPSRKKALWRSGIVVTEVMRHLEAADASPGRVINVGVIGCGGRGSGAVANAMAAGGLVVDDRLAELHAVGGIRQSAIERSLRQADSHGTDRNATAVECDEHLLETRPFLAKLILGRNLEIIEMQKSGVGATQTHLVLFLADGEAWYRLFHDERADTLVSQRGVHCGKHNAE